MLTKRPNYSKTLISLYLLLAPKSDFCRANSADPDAAFHQSLHCLLGQNRSSVKEYIFFESITCGPSIYTSIGHHLSYKRSSSDKAYIFPS